MSSKPKQEEPKLSPAMQLLTLVWQHSQYDSHGRVNTAMREALILALCSGMAFEVGDFAKMGQFRWGYWAGSELEWIYSTAVTNLNESAVLAWEAHTNREPFRGNNVTLQRYGRNYLHTNNPARQRERLAFGFSLPLEGRRWYVTGFDDEKGLIRLASYASGHPDGKPEKLRKLTHEELKALCPAPKKAKKKKEVASEPS